LYNDQECGSGRHFVSGQAAKAWDRYNVDWLPTLNLGHDKKIDKTNLKQASQRGQRASKKERKHKEQQERERALAEEIAAKKRRLNEPVAKFPIFHLKMSYQHTQMHPHKQTSLNIYSLRHLKKDLSMNPTFATMTKR